MILKKYRIIFFDQRGAGKSTQDNQELSAKTNNTALLLQDADHIRQVLGIDKWVIAGNSWGTTLALLYAEKFPEHVLGLVLRGTFLAQSKESLSGDNSPAALAQPEAWRDFKLKTQALMTSQKIDETLFETYPSEKKWVVIYYHLLTQSNFEIQQQATALLNRWSSHILALTPFPDRGEEELPDEHEVNACAIEFHYAYHDYFLEEPDQILNQIDSLIRLNTPIPIHMINGTKDLICSLKHAKDLKSRFPDGWVTEYDVLSGHVGTDETNKATVLATNSLARTIEKDKNKSFNNEMLVWICSTPGLATLSALAVGITTALCMPSNSISAPIRSIFSSMIGFWAPSEEAVTVSTHESPLPRL